MTDDYDFSDWDFPDVSEDIEDPGLDEIVDEEDTDER